MGCICKDSGGALGGWQKHSQQDIRIGELYACTRGSKAAPHHADWDSGPFPPLRTLPKPPQPHRAAGRGPLPYHEAVCVDLRAAAAAEQDPRVAHDGAGGELLALEGRGAGQQLVQVLRDVHGAVPVKDIVDDVPRLQRPLQHRNVLLCIQELQDLFPEDRE